MPKRPPNDDSGNERNNRNNDRIIRHQRQERARIQDVDEKYGAQLRHGPEKPQRRERCENDLALFSTTYFPKIFKKKFSPAHLRAFELIQQAIEDRDKYAFAMPRGTGKSTICEAALHWAAVYGKSRFTVLVNATKEMAEERIEDIKNSWLTSALLLEDFPEVACPILHMQGETRRTKGQHYLGDPTMIIWEKRRLILPTIDVPYAKQSGAIIQTAGITGNIRGRNKTTAEGEKIRPDLVLCDDPQTEQSADSPGLTRKRVKTLTKAIEFLGGSTKSCGVVIPCTIIEKNDLAAQFLDRQLHPEYHGERTKMLISFPTNLDLWNKYHEIRTESQLNDQRFKTPAQSPATKFYKANRKRMDEGAVVMWPEGYDEDKAISAVEFCMQLYLKDAESFFSEFQNDPQEEDAGQSYTLKPEDLANQISGIARSIVPHDTTMLVAQIDVQKPVLYWKVLAFRAGFSGDVVEYGAWPDQGVKYFTLQTLKKTLKQAYKNHGDEAALLKGLQDLFAFLCTREWKGESDLTHSLTLLGCDENYQTDIVHKAIRTSPHRNIIVPYRGRGITAAMLPLCSDHIKKKDGEVRGEFWKMVPNKNGLRTLQADVNYWKSFAAARLTTAIGDSGSIGLPLEKKGHNQMLIEQLTSEHSIEMKNETYGRTVHQWSQNQVGRDNHLWDGLVGCCVLASVRGMTLAGLPTTVKKKKPKFKRSVYE